VKVEGYGVGRRRHRRGKPRVVEVKGMALEADFQPYAVRQQLDKPGFIGAMASLLKRRSTSRPSTRPRSRRR
jgi:hypothetical protein